MDKISAEARSRNMAKIDGKNTKPELHVRKMLHSLGYRYRLHVRGLPGRPDIVFPARRKVVFVHGCFWHRHEGCRYSYHPKSRPEFWGAKFARNVQRDSETAARLKEAGWAVLVVWECDIRERPAEVESRLTAFLGPPRQAAEPKGQLSGSN
ncbi:very short patch repair endonuclease [Microvirga sp. CF3062]|uniref:very short patch repair endonuclease n=1 Tax=Microvirga sp. CF3062 TaxID=3110182 RepID=UPI002E7637CB|nr:very short patch repair endonuclease [Microvirga sp. CF3062]MEE1656755.1 very short patch repair endonuclease [Microvirga sp. CF3062]